MVASNLQEMFSEEAMSGGVKRWTMDISGDSIEVNIIPTLDDAGEWIKFADHEREVAELKETIEAWRSGYAVLTETIAQKDAVIAKLKEQRDTVVCEYQHLQGYYDSPKMVSDSIENHIGIFDAELAAPEGKK